MNDTLLVKKILTSTIGTSQLDATVRSFPRVASSSYSDQSRQSLHVGTMSPTVLRVAHVLRSNKNAKQRSLFQIKQTLTRLDASSNPIKVTDFDVAIQTNIPADVTQAEWLEAFALLIGAILDSDAALAKALFNAEV